MLLNLFCVVTSPSGPYFVYTPSWRMILPSACLPVDACIESGLALLPNVSITMLCMMPDVGRAHELIGLDDRLGRVVHDLPERIFGMPVGVRREGFVDAERRQRKR